MKLEEKIKELEKLGGQDDILGWLKELQRTRYEHRCGHCGRLDPVFEGADDFEEFSIHEFKCRGCGAEILYVIPLE